MGGRVEGARGVARRGRGGASETPNPLISPPIPRPPPPFHQRSAEMGGTCHGWRPGYDFAPPFFPAFLLSFFFFPFPFFVNEKRRSRAISGTAALGVFVAAPSERARARSSGGLATLAHSCSPPPASAARGPLAAARPSRGGRSGRPAARLRRASMTRGAGGAGRC